MSLKAILSIVFSIMAVLLAGLLIFALFLYQTMQDIVQSEENRYESYVRADELRQSSDDLTRLARTYVISGDDLYESMYWDILDIRNGKKPRPESYERIYWDFVAAGNTKPRPDTETIALQDIMKDLGFTDREFDKLQEAQANSDGLVTTETIAMNAVKGLYNDGLGGYTKQGEPDLEMARRVMHDSQYHRDKAKIMEPIDDFFALLDQRTRATVDGFIDRGRIFLWGIIVLIVCLTVTAIGAFVAINRWLKKMVNNLSYSAEELNVTSQGVAKSSQQLSEGTTEQAASLEETSSSMEEVSSQTKETANNASSVDGAMNEVNTMLQHAAENTQKATHLSEEARSSAESGVQAMGTIAAAMNEIREGSEKVTDIIEVINEITHQTKMLATNAAIEAARAGDQGKGFAVVADEVSKLAEHSKTAAKEIAGLIKESSRKAEVGSDLAEKGQEVLQEILGKSSKVADLINDISNSSIEQAEKVTNVKQLVDNIRRASNEQASGTSEISRAIMEMDQITQSNAANAEETAGLAQRLAEQAQVLQSLLNGLSQKVKHSASPPVPPKLASVQAPKTSTPPPATATTAPATGKLITTNASSNKSAGMGKRVDPTKAIPMRDDFREF